MRTITRDIASAVLVSADGKIFLAKKNTGGVYEGAWTIPCGGIDEGETRGQAMMREVREETGIDVTGMTVELVDVGKGESEKTLKDTGECVVVSMTFYDFRVILGQPADAITIHLADEFEEGRWFSQEELTIITMSPSCEKLFRKLGYLL